MGSSSRVDATGTHVLGKSGYDRSSFSRLDGNRTESFEDDDLESIGSFFLFLLSAVVMVVVVVERGRPVFTVVAAAAAAAIVDAVETPFLLRFTAFCNNSSFDDLLVEAVVVAVVLVLVLADGRNAKLLNAVVVVTRIKRMDDIRRLMESIVIICLLNNSSSYSMRGIHFFGSFLIRSFGAAAVFSVLLMSKLRCFGLVFKKHNNNIHYFL